MLDTHAWVWWNAAPGKLSPAARQAIDEADTVGVSAISCWEVSMLVAKKRLLLDRDVLAWVHEALPEDGVLLLPISASIGVAAGALGQGFHGDPADRIIVATALEAKATLVTKDNSIRSFAGVDTVW